VSPTPLIDDPGLQALRRWADILDNAFRVPGTRNARFGLDPIVGLIPGIGDLVSPIFAILILFHAVRLRVPRVIVVRMILNAVIDLGVGAIPVLGDTFDFLWKSNAWNLRLLETHAGGLRHPSAGDWLFVSLCALVLLGIAMIPVLLALWIGRRLL
jgi:Domain of unknown function (DUF4112)